MPSKPKRPCNEIGCSNLTIDRYCEVHKKEQHKKYDDNRKTSAARGYNARWRKARKRYLSQHPFCIDCEKESKLTIATVVDHIIPHKGDYNLFWDESNWQPMCASHHNRKTAREDGGFGL